MSGGALDVRHVAALARLDLSAEELAEHETELGRILDYVAQLDEVNTEGVPPMLHPGGRWSCGRPDRARPGLARQQALAGAPASEDGMFRVPAVIEDE